MQQFHSLVLSALSKEKIDESDKESLRMQEKLIAHQEEEARHRQEIENLHKQLEQQQAKLDVVEEDKSKAEKQAESTWRSLRSITKQQRAKLFAASNFNAKPHSRGSDKASSRAVTVEAVSGDDDQKQETLE